MGCERGVVFIVLIKLWDLIKIIQNTVADIVSIIINQWGHMRFLSILKDQGYKIKNTRSRIQDQWYKIKNTRSRITNQGLTIKKQDQGYKIKDIWSRLQDQGRSRIQNLGYKI